MRRLVYLAVALRLVAALAMLGPWTDEASELAGWDVHRFQQMADQPGRHWVDHEVEYPPGSVVVIEALAVGGVVATHRILVVLSLALDLGVAATLRRLGGDRAGGAYLLLGLPLVPMGLVRLDLWSVAPAVAAVAALSRRRPRLAGGLVAMAALVKVWPVLLVAAFVAARRWQAAMAATVVGAVGGAAWLAYGGWSLEPVSQILSLRGATGWHLESPPGSVLALFTDEAPRRQLDAFRIGTIDPTLVLAGRIVTVTVVVSLVALARRRKGTTATATTVETLAVVMLGSTAALIVTAPLLSPQFLLWLTPWAALLAVGPHHRPLVALTAVATAATGGTLALYDPPNLGRTVPAALLLGRDLALAAVVVAALAALARPGAPTAGPLAKAAAVDQVERNTR